MGCGSSMSESQLMKQSATPQKLPQKIDLKSDHSVQEDPIRETTNKQQLMKKQSQKPKNKLQSQASQKNIQKSSKVQLQPIKQPKKLLEPIKEPVNLPQTIIFQKKQLPPLNKAKFQTENPSQNQILKSETFGSNVQIQQTRSNDEQVVESIGSCQQIVCGSYPQIKTGHMYLFGQAQQERKIVRFDMEKQEFQIIASRATKVETNEKYQPSDVIFQESQQLQASHLYNKFSHPPYNFMYATYVSEDRIFLCGGINAEFNYVSDQAFMYRIKNGEQSSIERINYTKGNNLLGLKFEKLSYMNKKRYSHMGAFFPMGKLSYLFVFGGRDSQDQPMTHCQKYSFTEKKWIQIAPMQVQKSTGFCLVFRSKIYVFGGYTDEMKRTKKIQVYEPLKDYWETLEVKLHRGLQAGLIFSVKPNEILIMGGNMQLGTVKSVIKVNLVEKTYIWDSHMKNQRFLQKGAKYKEQIIVFGGDFQDTMERYTPKDRKWKDLHVSYKQFIAPEQINSYSQACQTLNVKFDESLLTKNEPANEFERVHIFGNDQFPCILQINVSKWVLRKKPVPMTLRLRCNMSVSKIKQGKYFLCGGMDFFGEKCSRAAFLYYPGTNNALEVQKMQMKKYQMAICCLNQFVYIFGGKTAKQGQIISSCERFDLKQQKWQQIGSLSKERAKAKTLIIGQKIFIWGGCDSLQNISEIQIFNTETKTFTIFQKVFPISSQITGLVSVPNSSQVIIFSYNDLLHEQYCHSCTFDPDQKRQLQGQKMQESVLICSAELQLKEAKLKTSIFDFLFTKDENIHFVTNKGIQTCKYPTGKQETVSKAEPKIIINQVQMLQFPIGNFSFATL